MGLDLYLKRSRNYRIPTGFEITGKNFKSVKTNGNIEVIETLAGYDTYKRFLDDFISTTLGNIENSYYEFNDYYLINTIEDLKQNIEYLKTLKINPESRLFENLDTSSIVIISETYDLDYYGDLKWLVATFEKILKDYDENYTYFFYASR